jgi:tetratricopeptide (TPR) repeat protein
MSKWMLFMFLTLLTGSPLLSLGLMVVLVLVADRFTWQLLPSPVRLFKRFQRAGYLAGVILTNPHERRARHELADIRVAQKRYAEAVDILKPNLEAGDEDVDTLYLLGVAYLGVGEAQRGELLLDEAEKLDAGYQLGAIPLERGRFRLKRGDAKGAVEALERFNTVRHGSVEGRFLLAQALTKAGRADEAWAWRARPSRPMMYAAALAVVLGTVGAVVSRMELAPRSRGYGGYDEQLPSAAGLEEDLGE